MEIIVCVKQILDPEVLRFNVGAGRLEEFYYVMNPYDRAALAEALRLRSILGGSVTAISLGGEEAHEALRISLTMGADRAVHVQTGGALDPHTTSKILAEVIKGISYDLILCGSRSIDTDGRYVGVGIAEELKIPVVCGVTRLDLSDGRFKVYRKLRGGDREILELQPPTVLTVEEDIAQPVHATLKTYVEGLKKPVDKVKPLSLEVKPRTIILQYVQPKPRTRKTVLSFSPSASERIKMLMSGGLKEKASKRVVEGSPERLAAEFLSFLEKNKILRATRP